MQEAAATTDFFTYLYQKPLYITPEPVSLHLINLENNSIASPKLLLLLKNAFNQDIAASDFELLKKMADWMRIEKKEVAVCLVKEEQFSFPELRTKHAIENMICYGVTPAAIGLNIEYRINKPVRFMNCRMIFTAPFAEVQKNSVIKTQFFSEAGKLFNPAIKK